MPADRSTTNGRIYVNRFSILINKNIKMGSLKSYVVQLTKDDHLAEYQSQSTYHSLRKNLYDSYGEVTQISVWNVPNGTVPVRYLIYNNGGTLYVVDEAGNQTTFSALEAIGGDRPGSILKAYNILIAGNGTT